MTDFLEHKGYKGSVEYSSEDEMLFGKVMFIDSLLLFHGKTVEEIKSAFIQTVDAYLEFCHKTNRSPNKPYKGSFNVRVQPDIHRAAANYAASLGISLNEFVSSAIEKEINNSRKQPPQGWNYWGVASNTGIPPNQYAVNAGIVISTAGLMQNFPESTKPASANELIQRYMTKH